MQTSNQTISKKSLWTGRVLSGIAIVMLFFDSITKILKVDGVVKAAVQSGYPVSLLSTIGTILLVCLIVYAIPRTAAIGAMLITGYLGGAFEANLRAGLPLFSMALFPIYFAVIVWGGLFLREQRVREIFSVRKVR